jgi:hypothetical protein
MSSLTPIGQPSVRAARRNRWQVIVLWSVFAVVVIVGLLLAASNGAGVPVLLDGAAR